MENGQSQDFSPPLRSTSNTLRFITCGSVDDGKSTLIGRLFHDSGQIFEDQLSALKADSRLYGTQKGKVDYALLVDGLQAERQQGITIDVAYRYFHTWKRRYIVADTPGHEQYTRNMATGASTADVAVILVDARKGILRQTLRHSRIVATMNCRHVVLAINKMDLVGFDQSTFDSLVQSYLGATKSLSFDSIYAVPLCCLDGDNLLTPSPRTPWFRGKPLLAYLDCLSLSGKDLSAPFRLPIQYVNRPHLDFRGYCGRVASGILRRGDQVKVLPSGVTTQVRRLILGFDDVESVQQGDSITVTFTEDIDGSRGCVLVSPEDPPPVADEVQATLIWMDQEPMQVGRPYILKIGTKETLGTITSINSIEDLGATVDSMPAPQRDGPPERLQLNEIAQVTIKMDSSVVVEPFRKSRSLGGFILIDKKTYATVAAGMTQQVQSAGQDRHIHWHHLSINQKSRGEAKHQTPRCLWFTGLSGSGKSTIANLLEKRLFADLKHTYVLDGDNLRYGINGDLAFSDADRTENVRRVAHVAKLMVDAGLIVLVSLIAPFRSDRQRARGLFGAKEFIEIYIETPLHICEERDPKGLYAKARCGVLQNFTGIGSPYEPPQRPDLAIDTRDQSPEECVDKILRHLANL